MSSSYDPPREELITPAEFKASMRLVRLQIAIPISVLMSMGANLVCALALKPGLAGISALKPTLLTPNSFMIGFYWIVLYILQVGFCLELLLVRKDETKETLVNGVGLRFAIANWLMAAWAVCWTLQVFLVSEIIIIVNVINVFSILMTLIPHPPSFKRPLDALFIHAPMLLLFGILFQVDWLHNGFIALNWIIRDESQLGRYTWQAVGSVAAVNVITAIWAGLRRSYIMTTASMYLLFSLLLSSPRTTPTLPTTALPKPTPLLITLIVCLVLHPVALVAGLAWKRTREREGRIRLEEEVERAEEEERAAEIAAARA